MGAGGVSVSSSQCCCGPKTALKKVSLLKKVEGSQEKVIYDNRNRINSKGFIREISGMMEMF